MNESPPASSASLLTRTMPLSTFRFPGAISVHWFIYLRWVAVLGQLVTILAAWKWFVIPLQLQPLLVTVGVTALTNLTLMFWYLGYRLRVAEPAHSRLWYTVVSIVMALDLVLLTCLLYFSGGPTNPFWVFFFVNLCLAGVELTALVTWCLNGLAIVCFAFLLFDHVPLDALGVGDLLLPISHSGKITQIHTGVFYAFITCASVIVSFTTLVASRLRKRDEELRKLESQRIRSEKLEALGTLAAGAAHELATPLGTIAVIIGELQHQLQRENVDPLIQEDMATIRSELNRCRSILNHMSARAGEGTIERKETVQAKVLLDMILAEVKEPERVVVEIDPKAAGKTLYLEPYVTAQALRGMIKNGLEASPPEGRVSVFLREARNGIVLEFRDQGEGIPLHLLGRIGEPFFTTKSAGKGMGLGVFLTRSVVERLGGAMTVDSKPEQGTTVTCFIPAQNGSTL
ncbi:MAG: HAMP domain-containing histidine kinase [Planctomycetaceae bacterium]|nr:HAMP domain-containing histidine kinase [Planctomycetaceae bacterium]